MAISAEDQAALNSWRVRLRVALMVAAAIGACSALAYFLLVPAAGQFGAILLFYPAIYILIAWSERARIRRRNRPLPPDVTDPNDRFAQPDELAPWATARPRAPGWSIDVEYQRASGRRSAMLGVVVALVAVAAGFAVPTIFWAAIGVGGVALLYAVMHALRWLRAMMIMGR